MTVSSRRINMIASFHHIAVLDADLADNAASLMLDFLDAAFNSNSASRHHGAGNFSDRGPHACAAEHEEHDKHAAHHQAAGISVLRNS